MLVLKNTKKEYIESTLFKKLILNSSFEGKLDIQSECSALLHPNYLPETLQTCELILDCYIFPLLKDKEFAEPKDVKPYLDHHIRGWNMAKAAVEMAYWAAAAQLNKQSLSSYIGGTLTRIPSGTVIAIQKDKDDLRSLIRKSLNLGTKRIKFKIKPGFDVDILKEAKTMLPNDVFVIGDANSAYEHVDPQHLARLPLDMIEQPLASNDFLSHASLQKELPYPICLDESIQSLQDVMVAHRLNACEAICLKPAKVGGFSESLAIYKYCIENDLKLWIGGMYETSIGKSYTMALNSLPGLFIPGDLAPCDWYWNKSLLANSYQCDKDGYFINTL